MGSPYDIDYTVPPSKAPFWYRGKCYGAGDVVPMSEADYLSCQPTKTVESQPCGFTSKPKEGSDPGKDDYRERHLIPDCEPLVIPVASIEGCRPPRYVVFNFKGCLAVGYDADPSLEATDGTGADCPQDGECRDITGVSTLHIVSTEDTEACDPVDLCLTYYC